MEAPRNLNEYRVERLEYLKTRVLDIATNHLLERTDDDYDAVLGQATLSAMQVYIMPIASNEGYVSAPNHVVTEVAIKIANELMADDTLPYTVDMTALTENPPSILVKKM